MLIALSVAVYSVAQTSLGSEHTKNTVHSRDVEHSKGTEYPRPRGTKHSKARALFGVSTEHAKGTEHTRAHYSSSANRFSQFMSKGVQ